MINDQRSLVSFYVILVLLFGACNDEPKRRSEYSIPAKVPERAEKALNWAGDVQFVGIRPNHDRANRIHRALMPDSEYDSYHLETIRRVVYRVRFRTPNLFREKKSNLIAPAGELYIDVALERLRARFVGPGWPVEEGAEVRLRRDALGVYVFDQNGGQQLGPGGMASWFVGGLRGHSRSSVRIRRERTPSGEGLGELICALLAEWTGQSREVLMRRCSAGSIPPAFGFGPWRAELTASVPMEIERRKLRADEKDPPETIEVDDSRTFIDPAEFTRIIPYQNLQDSNLSDTDGTLQFVNHTSTKVIVILEGNPVAWVDENSKGRFSGFRPGRYRIGAIRPFGGQLFSPKIVVLPGKFSIGRPSDSVMVATSKSSETNETK